MLFPFGTVGFLVQTLNLSLFNVDCECRNSPSGRRTSAAKAISTDTGAFRKEKYAPDKLKIIYLLLLLSLIGYFRFTVINVVAVIRSAKDLFSHHSHLFYCSNVLTNHYAFNYLL
jgi:hypothetical protein